MLCLGDPRSGVLRARGGPFERAAARVCREAGAAVATRPGARPEPPGTPTCRCREARNLPLTLQWSRHLLLPACPSAREAALLDHAGAALAEANRAKERTYPEFADARRCRLVVLGFEVGSRWSAEAAAFIRLLARARARSAAVTQRAACVAAFVTRWSGLLSIAAARSFAASLLCLPISNTATLHGEARLLSDVLADSSETPPLTSRMG